MSYTNSVQMLMFNVKGLKAARKHMNMMSVTKENIQQFQREKNVTSL